jgi:hypothetical protein
MKPMKNKPSEVKLFRDKWLKKGIELINITELLETRMGNSGWCNEFNEPEETCHHIKLLYRDEIIAVANGGCIYPIDDDKYVVFMSTEYVVNEERDFIIFRKVNKRRIKNE